MASDLTSRLGGARSTLGMKAPCRACATSNVTLSGTQTIDGVALAANDRVLLTAQATGSENGIYIVKSGAWARAKDWDSEDDFTAGTVVLAHLGTNAGVWKLTTTGNIVLGTTTLSFVRIWVDNGAALDVTDFGCALDGVTDDTVNYQAAVDQAVASGRPLYHPPGTAILDYITVTGSLTLTGAGPGSVAKRKAGSSGGMFRLSGIGSDVSFSMMRFDGNYTNQSSQAINYDIISQADGATANPTDTHRLSVANCEFFNSSYCCVRFQGDLSAVSREVMIVENCVFRGGADGVENAVVDDYIPRDIEVVDGAEAWVRSNYFHSDSVPTKGRCAVVNAMTSVGTAIYSDIHITDNRMTFRGCNVSQALGAIDIYIWGNNCIISGNVFKSSMYSPIKWKQNAAQTTVSFNKIDSLVGTNYPVIDGNAPTYGPIKSGASVVGNQITACEAGSSFIIAVAGSFGGAYADALVVSSNQITNCSAAAAIYVSTAKNVTIDSNVIAGSGTINIAFNLSGSNQGLFSVYDNRVDQTTPSYSLYLDNNDAAFDASIVNNIFSGSSVTYAMYLAGRRIVSNGNLVSGGVAGVLVAACTDVVLSGMAFFGLSSSNAIDVQGAVTNLTLRDNTALGFANPLALTVVPTNLYESNNSWSPARQAITAASSAVTNTVTATKFNQSITIPANRLRVGMIIRIKAQGIATSTNSTDTLATTLFIGGTGGTALVACAAADVADGNIFWMEYDLTVRAIGASGSIVGIGAAKPSPGAEGGTADTAAYKDNFLGATTINTTTTQEVCVTAQWSVASTSNSCRLDVLTVEYIY